MADVVRLAMSGSDAALMDAGLPGGEEGHDDAGVCILRHEAEGGW